MDRLKDVELPKEYRIATDLHSNMDRLKALIALFGIMLFMHLHSNMDRLKANALAYELFAHYIYIPIWID